MTVKIRNKRLTDEQFFKIRKEEVLSQWEPEVLEFIKRVKVVLDASLDERSPTAVDLTIVTTEGRTHVKKLDIAPGFPGNPLGDADHLARFTECIDYAKDAIPPHRLKELVDSLGDIDKVKDVRSLVHLMSRQK